MKTKFTLLPWRGSNPCITYLVDVRIGNSVLPTELHGIPYIFIKFEAHAGAKPCLRYLVIRWWHIANLAPSVSFCLISAFLRLIRLSFSPTIPSALHYYLPAFFFAFRGQLVAAAGYGNCLSSVGCTYGLVTVYFHSIDPESGIFRCRFSSESRTGLAALAPFVLPVISKCDCAYLPGLTTARPSALSDVPESNRPSFLVWDVCLSTLWHPLCCCSFSSFWKPAAFTGGREFFVV